MEFEELLRRRRMVRRYRPDEVASEILGRIVDAARRAPSAGFSQGQRFVVVTDPGLRGQIAGLAGEEIYLVKGFEPWLSPAPVHIVVCTDPSAYQSRYAAPDKSGSNPAEWPVSYPVLDAGASLMLLLLAAVNEGLAAGFLGAHRLAGVGDLLGIPAGVEVVGLVTLGHPAPDRRSGSLEAGRAQRDDVVHWERWGRTNA